MMLLPILAHLLLFLLCPTDSVRLLPVKSWRPWHTLPEVVAATAAAVLLTPPWGNSLTTTPTHSTSPPPSLLQQHMHMHALATQHKPLLPGMHDDKPNSPFRPSFLRPPAALAYSVTDVDPSDPRRLLLGLREISYLLGHWDTTTTFCNFGEFQSELLTAEKKQELLAAASKFALWDYDKVREPYI